MKKKERKQEQAAPQPQPKNRKIALAKKKNLVQREHNLFVDDFKIPWGEHVDEVFPVFGFVCIVVCVCITHNRKKPTRELELRKNNETK